MLAGESDLALILPPAPEACPMGLAPTTSTSMMMALGDALAIALLERNGFSEQDFQVLHPGGQLGSALLRIADVMQRPESLPLCDEATPMAEALLIMTRSSGDLRSFGCVGIVDDENRLIGMITDRDIACRGFANGKHAGALTARDVMSKGIVFCRDDEELDDAVHIMEQKQIRRLPVLNDKKRMIGMLSLGDVSHSSARELSGEVLQAVSAHHN